MLCHEPECIQKVGLLYSKSRSQQGLIWSKYYSFYYIIWTVDSLATKLVWWYMIRSQSVLWKKLVYCIQGQGYSEGSKCWCLSRYLLNQQTFFLQTWYCDSLWVRVSSKKIDLLFQGQDHCKSSCDQTMTISTVSFELLILVLPKLVW